MDITPGLIVAPVYEDDRELKHTGPELEIVREELAGETLDSPSATGLDQVLGEERFSLVHFACHASADGQYAETLDLQDGQSLNSEELLGFPGLCSGVAAKRPLVFLNACEAGRLVPALTRSAGFAKSFLALGASAVIAPAWRVDDRLAAAAARRIYEMLLSQPDIPVAEAVRRIRALTYDDVAAEDTWAAYCFFGSPTAIARL